MSKVETIKTLRREADRIVRICLQMKQNEYVLDCKKQVMLAKSWLGSVLAVLGDNDPYVPTKDADKIPQTADRHEGRIVITNDHLLEVNELRKDLQLLNDDLCTKITFLKPMKPDGIMYLGFASKCLHEAKFFLGFELGRIRDEHHQKGLFAYQHRNGEEIQADAKMS